MIKTIFKILGFIVSGLAVLMLIGFFAFNESKPDGESGEEAELLAQKVLKAVNYEAWDTTHYIQWSFRDIHHYLWDRKTNTVLVEWGNNKVYLHTKTVSGKAFKNEEEIVAEQGDKMIQKAWAFFCNDSFWLLAYTKLYDEGVTRSLVKLEDDSKALMVTYNSGGVTPGDSYLWILDENYRPKAWKMWTSLIPVGGLEFSWVNWKELPTGALVAQDHLIGPMNTSIRNLAASHDLKDLDANLSYKIKEMHSLLAF